MDLFGKSAKFHHIGMVVQNINEFASDKDVIVDELNGVKAFFTELHGLVLEIVAPIDETSPAYGPLKNNQKLYHLAFEVKDLKAALNQAKKHGFLELWQATPAKAFNNKEILWLHSKKYGLVELILP